MVFSYFDSCVWKSGGCRERGEDRPSDVNDCTRLRVSHFVSIKCECVNVLSRETARTAQCVVDRLQLSAVTPSPSCLSHPQSSFSHGNKLEPLMNRDKMPWWQQWCLHCCEQCDSQGNTVGVLRTCLHGHQRNKSAVHSCLMSSQPDEKKCVLLVEFLDVVS